MQPMKRGCRGEAVKTAQYMLNEKGYACGKEDGLYGAKTEQAVKTYQEENGLKSDGILGETTLARLARDNVIKAGSRGPLVRRMQALVKAYDVGEADGVFGGKTERAVKAYQRENGLNADGVVGEQTWKALLGENRTSGQSEPQSEHFRISEFRCKDGTKVPGQYYGNLQRVMALLEQIRTACGNGKITIVSGYRTLAHNQKCGGAPKSQHLTASAADIRVQGKTPAQVYKICDALVGNRGGVGKYKNFTHVDVRGYRARW